MLQVERREAGARLQQANRRLMTESLSLGLMVLLCLVVSFAGADLLLGKAASPALYVIRCVQLAFVTAVLLMLSRGEDAEHPLPITLFSLSAIFVTAASSAIVSGDISLNLVVFPGLALGAACLFPWGLWPQSVVVAGAVSAMYANAYLLSDVHSPPYGWPSILGSAAVTLSSLLVAAIRRRSSENSVRAQLLQERCSSELTRLRSEQEQILRQRTEELAHANEELRSFDYSVAHDLRVPLRVMKGLLDSLEEDCGDLLPAAGQHWIGRLRATRGRMEGMVEGFLGLAAVKRRDLRLESVNLSLLAAEIIEDLQRTHPVSKVATVVARGLTACGDSLLLHTVLENLIGNAWKYSAGREDPRIEFGSSESGGKTIYFVRDNGIGFDPSLSGDLFVPFKRLHQDSGFDGRGIGLATVARILERHGGRIWAEGAPERGATFYFTLGSPEAGAAGS